MLPTEILIELDAEIELSSGIQQRHKAALRQRRLLVRHVRHGHWAPWAWGEAGGREGPPGAEALRGSGNPM